MDPVLKMGLASTLIGGVPVAVVGVRITRRWRWVLVRGRLVRLDTGNAINPATAVKYPVVSYVDAAEKTHEGRSNFGANWFSQQPGDPVDVYYDPDDPDRMVLRSMSVEYFALAMFGLWLVVGLGFLAAYLLS